MYKISVIVPVFNTEKYLDKCLNSILNQTYNNIEIIIINDGSSDSSEKIINKYIELYPNIIKYYYLEHKGVAFARNYGISKITGEYFIFVDSDDYIEPNLLNELVKYLDSDSNIDIIKYKMNVISEKNTNKINGPVFSKTTGENAFNNLCFNDVLIDTPCLYMINSSFFKDLNLKFLENTYREDFGLMPLLIVSANNFLSIELYGYNYFKSDNSIMRNSDYAKTLKKAEDLFLHYDNMISFIESNQLNQLTIDNLKQYYTTAILLTMNTLNKTDKQSFISKFKNKHLIKNIKPKNLKQLIKKIILILNINLYLKLI